MSNLTSKLSKELFEKYESISIEEMDTLGLMEYGEIESMITTLIADYNTYKLLLVEEEYNLEEKQLDYDSSFTLLKSQKMEKGYKSTEAKERANYELTEQKRGLLQIQRDISLLKANIHSVEYQLRLKFQQLKIYGRLEEIGEE